MISPRSGAQIEICQGPLGRQFVAEYFRWVPRPFKLSRSLANLLHDLRVVTGVVSAPKIRVESIEAVEREFECRMPDPIVAYLAAGASAWGDGPVAVEKCLEQTLEFRDLVSEDGHQLASDGEPTLVDDFVLFDDDSNGNYIAFRRGAPQASEAVFFLHHEGWEVIEQTLTEEIKQRIEGARTDKVIAVDVYDEAEPVASERWASHVKFGRGLVIAESEGKITIRFDGGVEKTLKASFLNFEDATPSDASDASDSS